VPAGAELGVAVDGSEEFWTAASPSKAPAVLPTFSPYQTQPPQYIEVFNRGRTPFRYRVETGVPWLGATPREGTVSDQIRVSLSVDWERAPKGTTPVSLTVSGPGQSRVLVQSVVFNPSVQPGALAGFVESNGYVSIEAEHFDRAVDRAPLFWQLLPKIGRTGSGMTVFPATAPRQSLAEDAARLEYDTHLWNAGPVTVYAYLSPRNNVRDSDGLKYAISFDGDEPQVVNVTTALNGIPMNRSFERNTSNNVNLTSTEHRIAAPGRHVLKLWAIDPTVIVQKLVIDTGGLKSSYLGPPESHRAGARTTSAQGARP
jgi:hypothetical protein